MGLIFKLQCFLIKHFKSKDFQNYFITKKVFEYKSLNLLHYFEHKFSLNFNIDFYNYLLEAAIFKKEYKITEYLLDKSDLNFIQNKSVISNITTQILTDNLKEKNYFSWLAILASHTNLQLMNLEKVYNYEEHINFVTLVLTHKKTSNFFNNDETKSTILNYCHENAKKMFELLFLDIKLKQKAPQEVKPKKKINKI